MPLYDYYCQKCGFEREYFHKMAETPKFFCPDCLIQLDKAMTTGAPKRPDARWIRSINGIVNDLERTHRGKEEFIETREQARSVINKLYSDPHPKVQALRKRYLERF